MHNILSLTNNPYLYDSMIFNDIMAGIKIEDSVFNEALYPSVMPEVASTHFTPIEIAKLAALYLVDKPGTKVLDIGSGTGKFCMIGGACTVGHFTGVEQREHLHKLAIRNLKKYQLPNVEFIQANISTINFREYQAFYFYNAFFENKAPSEKIDDTIVLKKELYNRYSSFVKEQLDGLPIGTKLVTYFSYYDEIPNTYKIQSRIESKKLTMWEKVC